ncbi:hypothetical protein C9397_11165 [Xanthomonas vasicola pv. vasculorum]|uniref:Uncharacterized protein n=1 Tax=Xanthomonas vasicola pv. vasculorum TaxID=325776 RepID=A0AAE8JWX9_XANVA|nr:hypothetical protein C7V42_19815 [Xanthomonas vasicola pv. vasculorum]TWQ10785.1 hypothetical protein FQK02_20410 [Xanthomonas vasicola]AZM72704.1 hypothetical protein CXP37_19830 [Xanthomonas vasicola pv. vasculorum]OWF57917.1 hypothetical protein B1H32_19125 [Xanthomonas vasicola pv. vasculorum]OWF58040.1 hypothetical protein B1H41_19740 [Xanthomonas vasicola pv. vasculorum]
MPAEASVVAFSPTSPCAGQLHGSIAGHLLARRQPRNTGVRVRVPLDATRARVRARPAPPPRPLRWPGALLPDAAQHRRADAAARRPG